MAAASKTPHSTADRREALREALIDAAERRIAAGGATGLRARDLATDVGCALGAIYLVFADLDAIVGAVMLRTLSRLEAQAAAIASGQRDHEPTRQEAIDSLRSLARLYFGFARDNRHLWRALFEHPAPLAANEGAPLAPIHALIERQLRVLSPSLLSAQRRLYARAVFAAVHGVLSLGLDQARSGLSEAEVAWQVEAIVGAAATPGP